MAYMFMIGAWWLHLGFQPEGVRRSSAAAYAVFATLLREWRDSHRATQNEAAMALGISLRRWRSYETEENLLPKTVPPAYIGFDAQAKAA